MTLYQRVDHVLVIGREGPDPTVPIVINGDRAPQSVWPAGVRQRVRLINITPDDIVSVVLQTNESPVTWQPVAKDGASLPIGSRQAGGGEADHWCRGKRTTSSSRHPPGVETSGSRCDHRPGSGTRRRTSS